MNSLKPIMAYVSRYIGLIVLVTLTVIAGFVIWNYILPKYQEIQAMNDEIETLRTKRNDLTTYVSYLRELESTTLPLEEELVNYAIPSENDVISLIVTYEGLSKTPDMEVSPFDFAPGIIQSDKPGTDEDSIVRSAGEPVVDDDPNSTGVRSKELEFQMEVVTEKPEAALDFINKIHQTRRVFTIKELSWKNPLKDQNNQEENKIILTFTLRTHYYPTAPKISGSSELVNKGKQQTDFIAGLNNTTVYDALVLDAVEVGKEDLFTFESLERAPTPGVNPTPIQIQESSASATVTQPVIF